MKESGIKFIGMPLILQQMRPLILERWYLFSQPQDYTDFHKRNNKMVQA
ncbi:hypothetical protein C5S31_00075 [ANME-1 cluster archaeon GoMg2]|nr:hypothetical protein [ANME-1 cluster archaeon GoMg2]